jgi:hypothetical protein
MYFKEFDVRRNEYKLLKPHQYDFVNSHFVLDTLRDPDVLNHDRLEYAAKFTEKVGALSNTFKALAFQHDTRVNRQDEDRYFSRSRMANWDKWYA